MKETKFNKAPIEIGSILIRNGKDINGVYNPMYDGMLCEVVRVTGRVITVRYFKPISTRSGSKMWMDTLTTNCILYREDGQPDVIVRKPITGISQDVLKQLEQ